MDASENVVAKVLIIDDGNADTLELIKQFCVDNNLIGLKTHSDNVMSVLKSNVDLGGILMSESYHDSPQGGVDLALKLHKIRPELPIFLRRRQTASLDGLPERAQGCFCAAYHIDDMEALKHSLRDFIFSYYFPNTMVRGIQRITEDAMLTYFRRFSLTCETPYIVKDSIVCGEVFTLVPLESKWCRGYMMLQCENRTLKLDTASRDPYVKPKIQRISDVLGEITNMVWGSFKSHYVGDEYRTLMSQIQVPMLVMLEEKNISFGSSTPQLCFKYTLTDLDDQSSPPVRIYQRLVFNLSWSPEEFKEVQVSAQELVDAGELELF
ncbi:MAG: chemotaxis protein CheX [Aquabacterium sp.]|uniref:chemotaxis protein CheX n=1 Tax=Aquabacterium sp. TaxID=1872578 RepID=UPI0011F85EBC|nr:chemotaxis protein CheX [Aquabacterium sp.]TAK91389.1 MAG: chemotaxis protein CheX [Aquabacterium sp.]